MKHILFSTLLLIPSPASADITIGWNAYETGNYIEALEIAASSTKEDRYALACMAGVAQGGTVEKGAAAFIALVETGGLEP